MYDLPCLHLVIYYNLSLSLVVDVKLSTKKYIKIIYLIITKGHEIRDEVRLRVGRERFLDDHKQSIVQLV